MIVPVSMESSAVDLNSPLQLRTASWNSSYSLSMTVSSPNPWSVSIVLLLADTGQSVSWTRRLTGRVRSNLTCGGLPLCHYGCRLSTESWHWWSQTGCCCTSIGGCRIGARCGVIGPGNEGIGGLGENTCHIIFHIWQTWLTCAIMVTLAACCLGVPTAAAWAKNGGVADP